MKFDQHIQYAKILRGQEVRMTYVEYLAMEAETVKINEDGITSNLSFENGIVKCLQLKPNS